jgi:hypothetical protein
MSVAPNGVVSNYIQSIVILITYLVFLAQALDFRVCKVRGSDGAVAPVWEPERFVTRVIQGWTPIPANRAVETAPGESTRASARRPALGIAKELRNVE